jgi:hypothetical protein
LPYIQTKSALDGYIYSKSFQEMDGAAFRVPLDGGTPVKITGESDINALVFAVGRRGELVFQKGAQITQRESDGKVKRFRRTGEIAKGEPALQQITWADDGTLYLSDGGNLRRVGKDGIIRLVARIEGKLLERQI